jgi:hypothetical protein
MRVVPGDKELRHSVSMIDLQADSLPFMAFSVVLIPAFKSLVLKVLLIDIFPVRNNSTFAVLRCRDQD